MHYFCFGFDLDPAILAPLHSSNCERSSPLSLFSCLSWYLLSCHIVLALLTKSFSVNFLLFLPLLRYLSRYLLSHHVLVALNSVSLIMYISFRIIFLYLLFILILFHRPCSSLPLKGDDYDFSRLCFLSLFIFIIIFLSFLLFGVSSFSIIPFVFVFPHPILLFFFHRLSLLIFTIYVYFFYYIPIFFLFHKYIFLYQ